MKLNKKRRLARMAKNERAETPVVTENRHYRFAVDKLSVKSIRNDEMEGEKYLVVPMVMMVEGVHCGSQGPILYTKDELGALPLIWNQKPVVAYHPDGDSACTPEEITARKVGVIMNANIDNKGRLIAEAWIKETRCKKIDNRIWKAIQDRKTMECSIGVFCDVEETEGNWEGEDYIGIAHNLRSDHLAILPDLVGACSIEDGAGFVRNELRATFPEVDEEDLEVVRDRIVKSMQRLEKKSPAITALLKNEASYEVVRMQICSALCEKYPSEDGYAYPWVEAVYDGYFVYQLGGAMFKMNYNRSNADTIKLSGDPVKVRRVTEYKPVSNVILVENDDETETTNDSDITMNKNQLVADLIKNHGYSEEDRAELMKLEDATLVRIHKACAKNATKVTPPAKPTKPTKATIENEDSDEDDSDDEDDAEVEEVRPAKNKAAKNTEKPAKPVLSDEDRAALAYGKRVLAKNKSTLITKITAAKNNKFDEETLNAMDIDTLERVAALVAPVKSAKNQEVDEDGDEQDSDESDGDDNNAEADYSGMGHVANRRAGEFGTEDALIMEPVFMMKEESKK